jgi:hypothetical protein
LGRPVVALEPRVNEEKLRELLAFGAESPALDFKETCDLRETRDRVELTKDVGAMQVDGGYIVIGANSAGVPTGRLTAEQATLFDEARLRQILARWLPAPFDLLAAAHSINGNLFAVVYVAPSPKGMCIFKADGQYPDLGGRTATVFREGDVFVRDGTQSRRWQQPDIDRILEHIRNYDKERWRAELVDDFRDLLQQGGTAQAIARGPAQALTWQLDEETFEGVIIEQLRDDDTIPSTLLLERLPAELGHLLKEGRADDAKTLLDRLACLLALALRVSRPDLFDLTLSALVGIYEITFDSHGLDRQLPGPLPTGQLRLEIIERVMAVGAYAVRRRDWTAMRKLVLQRPEGRHFVDGFYTNWIRHAQTIAARDQLFTQIDDHGQRTEVGILSFVLATAARLSCLHPELPSEGAEDDRLIDSVVRFDALAMVTVLAFAPGDRDYPYYPNFAGFYWDRFEPLLAELIENRAMRDELHPGSDEALRADIRQMLDWARHEGRRFAGGGPLSNLRLVRFLQGQEE